MEEEVCEQVLGTWMGLWHRRRRRVPDRSEGTFRGRRDARPPVIGKNGHNGRCPFSERWFVGVGSRWLFSFFFFLFFRHCFLLHFRIKL